MLCNPWDLQMQAKARMSERMREAEKDRLLQIARAPSKAQGQRQLKALAACLLSLVIRPQSCGL